MAKQVTINLVKYLKISIQLILSSSRGIGLMRVVLQSISWQWDAIVVLPPRFRKRIINYSLQIIITFFSSMVLSKIHLRFLVLISLKNGFVPFRALDPLSIDSLSTFPMFSVYPNCAQISENFQLCFYFNLSFDPSQNSFSKFSFPEFLKPIVGIFYES